MFADVFPAEPNTDPLAHIVPRALCTVRLRLREIACAFRGHDYFLHHADRRACLRCVSCGHETPGWQVAPMMAPATRRALTNKS